MLVVAGAHLTLLLNLNHHPATTPDAELRISLSSPACSVQQGPLFAEPHELHHEAADEDT